MDKNYFLMLLENGYLQTEHMHKSSRIEFISEYIFEFLTYDSEKAEIFARKALEVCYAITNGTTFDYIKKSDDCYTWFLIMVNTAFFKSKIEYGTSIRGAWWDHKINFSSCGLFDHETQICDFEMDRDEWNSFINALIDFSNQA